MTEVEIVVEGKVVKLEESMVKVGDVAKWLGTSPNQVVLAATRLVAAKKKEGGLVYGPGEMKIYGQDEHQGGSKNGVLDNVRVKPRGMLTISLFQALLAKLAGEVNWEIDDFPRREKRLHEFLREVDEEGFGKWCAPRRSDLVVEVRRRPEEE